jgi:hypothetical protein
MIDNTASNLLTQVGQEGFVPATFTRIFLHFQDLYRGLLNLDPESDGQLAEIAIRWPRFNPYDYTKPEPVTLEQRLKHTEPINFGKIYLGLFTYLLPQLVTLAGRNQELPVWGRILEASEEIACRERKKQKELRPIQMIRLFRELLQ